MKKKLTFIVALVTIFALMAAPASAFNHTVGGDGETVWINTEKYLMQWPTSVNWNFKLDPQGLIGWSIDHPTRSSATSLELEPYRGKIVWHDHMAGIVNNSAREVSVGVEFHVTGDVNLVATGTGFGTPPASPTSAAIMVLTSDDAIHANPAATTTSVDYTALNDLRHASAASGTVTSLRYDFDKSVYVLGISPQGLLVPPEQRTASHFTYNYCGDTPNNGDGAAFTFEGHLYMGPDAEKDWATNPKMNIGVRWVQGASSEALVEAAGNAGTFGHGLTVAMVQTPSAVTPVSANAGFITNAFPTGAVNFNGVPISSLSFSSTRGTVTAAPNAWVSPSVPFWAGEGQTVDKVYVDGNPASLALTSNWAYNEANRAFAIRFAVATAGRDVTIVTTGGLEFTFRVVIA